MFRRLCLKCNSLRRLEKFKVHLIRHHSKSSEVSDNPRIEDYRFSFSRPILDEYGQQFLDNLDEDLLKKKNVLEFQISLWQAEGKEHIPSILSAHNWKYILTHIDTVADLERYLKKVYVRAEKIKKMKEDNVESFYTLRQPYDDDDLHIIQRVFLTRKYLNQWNGVQSMQHGPQIVIDMDYENTDENDNYETARQIETLYNFNLEHYQPCHLHFTSFHKNEILSKLHESNRTFMADFHRQSLLEVFPHDRLFYLVPEGDMIKGEELKEDTIFVLGGIGGTGERRRSLRRAISLGIPYGSLPLENYVIRKKKSTRDIYLHTVMRILLDKLAGVSWKVALERHLPDQKFEKFPGLPGVFTDSPKARKSYKQFEVLNKILVSEK